MSSYLREKKGNAAVYTIPAKPRFWFVVSYAIWSAILLIAILFIVYGTIDSIIKGRFGSVVNIGLGLFVFSIFGFLLVYLLNSTIYYLKGAEVLEIDGNGGVKFHRFGFYRFQKKQFYVNKLRFVSLMEDDSWVVGDRTAYEAKDAKIVIAFRCKEGNIWGRESSKMEFGASLSDAAADKILTTISNDLGIG